MTTRTRLLLPRIASLALVTSVLALAGCRGTPDAGEIDPKTGKPKMVVPKVTVAEVREVATTDYDEYLGRTEASESVEVRTRVFGYIKDIVFKDGDQVEAEQPLYKIEPDDYEAIHNQSLARITVWETKLELAQVKLARNDKLVKTGAVSKEDHDESIAAVKEADASLNAARKDAERSAIDLKYTTVAAPISGRIDRAYVTRGNLVTGGATQGTLLTRIVKEQPMFVYFDVDEKSLLRFMRARKKIDKAPGSLRELEKACFVKLADEEEYLHEGKLDFAANQLDPGTGTIRVRGEFTNEDRALASGLFVRLRIPVTDKPYKALMIPERAIGIDQSIKFVYVVGQDNVAVRQAIEPGRPQGELRIVLSGVKAGDRVISKGMQRVRPGETVEPQTEPAKKDAGKSAEHTEKP